MPSLPFRRQTTPADQLKSRAEDLRKATAELAVSVRDQAERVAEAFELAERTEPVRRRSRRSLALAGAGAAALFVALRLRKRGPRAPESGVPRPDVRPTAPGPSDSDLNDPALKAKVESELFGDPDVPKDRILVGVAGGVVTLRGTLDSEEQAASLTGKAEDIDGVRRVENLLTAGNGSGADRTGTA